MHPLFQKADDLSRQAIGAAIEVHRLKELKLIDGVARMIRPGANRDSGVS